MIKNKSESSNLTIDLTGTNGNAFALIGLAKKLAKQMGKDSDAIVDEMKSGDYENLVAVLDREFGDIVTLLR